MTASASQQPDAGAYWCRNWKVELARFLVADVDAEAAAGGDGEPHRTRDGPSARIGDRAARRVHHVRGPTTAGALYARAAPCADHGAEQAENGRGADHAFQTPLILSQLRLEAPFGHAETAAFIKRQEPWGLV
jgi:hypothetical protein